jgi:hypothetical protein
MAHSLWVLMSFNTERPSSHRYIFEKGMIIFTDVIDSTGYSDFNNSQKVCSRILTNLVLRALFALKVTSFSQGFKCMYASVVLNGEGITNPIPFLTCLEIFIEILVKDIYMFYN